MIGPGLAKACLRAAVVVRVARLARGTDARWREMFDAADALSEGSVRDEPQGRVWYGSTSLILALADSDPPAVRAFFVAFAAHDLHVRLRALRIACREATLRAPGPLGSSICEMRVTSDSRGLRIDVDVQAPLIGGRITRPRTSRGAAPP